MSTLSLQKYYMDISLDFGEEYGNPGIKMDENLFRYAVKMALKQLHGDTGCSIPVDILKYWEAERRGFLRFPARDLVRVWSAFTLFSRYEGLDCAFRVHKATPILASLSINIRTYSHKEKLDLEPKRKKIKCDT